MSPLNAQEKGQFARFLRQLVLFGSIFILIWMVLNHLIDYTVISHYELKYGEIIDPRVNANAIILGTSHAAHGINPMYLDDEEASYYNFAYNAGNPIFYLKWYELLFRRYYPKPDLIVYAVDWMMFDDNWMWRDFEHDSEYLPLDAFWKALHHGSDRKTLLLNRFPLIKNRDRLFGFARDVERFGLTGSVYVLDKYYRGYVPVDIEQRLQPTVARAMNGEEQIRAFHRLLNQFEADGISVVFVQIPEYLPGRENNGQNRELLHRIAEERGIPYIDYNTDRITEVNYDASAFLDWGHMSEEGSRKFTILLKADLERLASLQSVSAQD